MQCKQNQKSTGKAEYEEFLKSYIDSEQAAQEFLFHDSVEVGQSDSTGAALARVDAPASDIYGIIQVSKKYFNLARVNPGFKMLVTWSQKDEDRTLKEVSFSPSATKTIKLKKQHDGSWSAELTQHEVDVRLVNFKGVVDSSLWLSAYEAGVDPRLIGAFAGIFAWQIDFDREIRSGDIWRFVVEQKFVNNNPIGWGDILVAEYVNQGEPLQAALFPLNNRAQASYFAPDGSSLQRMFLKSPIRYGRISSRFKRSRYHPVLKVYRPHNGVDYAAKPGTPIMSVGDGIVKFAGRKRASGIMVKVRHNRTYETAYLHMRSIAKGVKNGRRVKQGQVIGYVGSTGLATGPHLHFSFYERGRFVDPLGKKFPSKDPVPKSKMSEFMVASSELFTKLPPWKITDSATQMAKLPATQNKSLSESDTKPKM